MQREVGKSESCWGLLPKTQQTFFSGIKDLWKSLKILAEYKQKNVCFARINRNNTRFLSHKDVSDRNLSGTTKAERCK